VYRFLASVILIAKTEILNRPPGLSRTILSRNTAEGDSFMKKTICELFAGVGGFRLGFDRLNSGWETVFFSQYEPAHRK